MSATQIVSAFARAMSNENITPPSDIIADGQLHRFSTNGKHGDTAGWYRLHLDGIPCGVFGDWRSGISLKWTDRADHRTTRDERRALAARITLLEKERAEQDKKREADALENLLRIWATGLPAATHEYTERKRLKGTYGARIIGRDLAVPAYDGGVLRAIQLIAPDGRKQFVCGSKVRGYFAIGKMNGTICIAEGFSTAATIHESTGHAVAVSFGAHGLLRVARTLRGKFPTATIVICGDDDVGVPGNPGLSAAREAARAVGALLAIPVFGKSRPEHASDFNDLMIHAGPEAVRASIEIARRV